MEGIIYHHKKKRCELQMLLNLYNIPLDTLLLFFLPCDFEVIFVPLN